MQQFFYDEQIRRFLLQFTRVFSNFQVEYGRTEDNSQKALYRVPVRYGDATRQAQTIIQQNSANSLPATPLMTFHVTNLNYARDRIQEPYFVQKQNVRQRYWDTESESYETTQGNAFTIEKMMPVPFDLEVNLDIWTSNTNQKLQLLEQLLTLFNPSLEIQSTENFIDWTSLSVMYLEQVTWSSRSIPQGTDDPIDIATLRFVMPIYISPPAKVKKLGVVEKIVASVFDGNGDMAEAIFDSDLLLGTRQKFTPFNYQTLLISNKLQVLETKAVVTNNAGVQVPTAPPSNLLWHTVVDLYGALRNGISQVRLDNPYDDSIIVGTVSYDPTDDRFLLFTVDADTIPANTLDAVNAIVDPQAKGPGTVNGLPSAASGQRYLFINDTGSGSTEDPGFAQAWRGTDGSALVANTNDIVEYDGTRWNIAFDSSNESNVQYVSNLTTSVQYRWAAGEWLKSYEGLYTEGNWSLVL
ncbi:tail sheath stabilizer and completion protein [bacterium]|nr:tail sheath stabilizer and completion protein [bacterium]